MARTRRELLKLSGGITFAGTVAGCTGDGEDREAEENDNESAAENGEGDHDHADEDHDHDDEDSHDHGHLEVEEFELVDDESDETVADIHDDHWHGSLQVPTGETVELGAVVVDAEGEEIPLGEHEEYELNAELAEGAQEGIVDIEPYGDHVGISGEEAGLTEVVFMLWHDDHADYEAPPIGTEVAEEFDDDDHDHDHDNGHEEDHEPGDEDHDDGHGHDEDDHDH